jgi:hypothetical protein
MNDVQVISGALWATSYKLKLNILNIANITDFLTSLFMFRYHFMNNLPKYVTNHLWLTVTVTVTVSNSNSNSNNEIHGHNTRMSHTRFTTKVYTSEKAFNLYMVSSGPLSPIPRNLML